MQTEFAFTRPSLSLSLSGWFSRQSHRGAAASAAAAAAGGAQMQSIFRAHKRGASERERAPIWERAYTIILLMKNANKNAAAQQIIKKIWLCACECGRREPCSRRLEN